MDKRKQILSNPINNNPDRAAAMGVELHRARKAKPPVVPDEEAGEAMPNSAAAQAEEALETMPAKQPTTRVNNLGKFARPPKKK